MHEPPNSGAKAGRILDDRAKNRSSENKSVPSNVWEANVLLADGKAKVRDYSERDT